MYYVYILTNRYHSVLYVGVTNNLERRVYEHKHHLISGFTDRYNVEKLIYFEATNDVKVAIQREKEIKGWTRKKKDLLIDSFNPQWKELYDNGTILFEV